MFSSIICAISVVFVSATISRDETRAADPVATARSGQHPVSDNLVTLPAMLPVEIIIVDQLNSKTSKMGEIFNIRLAAPIMIDGKVIVPAGVAGKGEVIHAAKARAAGKAGELILAARYLEYMGSRLPLRSLRYGKDATGKSNSDEAAAVGIVVAAPLVLFVTGGQVDIPAGLPATAKLAANVSIPLNQPILSKEENP